MTPKRKATQIAVVNLVHSRLTPTQPFSERLPTLWLLTFTSIPCERLRNINSWFFDFDI
ncbi:MAG: hypothetical protein LBK82_10955 [Planctomycetaceae bacterium]|nr:hypothetical protein [Planctomycetaceae bacterium]